MQKILKLCQEDQETWNKLSKISDGKGLKKNSLKNAVIIVF